MALLSSLRHRIFLASALLAVLPLAAAFRFVSVRLARAADDELGRSVAASATLVEQEHAVRLRSLTAMARLVADLPRLKAAVATHDAPTVEPLAREYRDRVGAGVLLVTDRERVLAAIGALAADLGDGAPLGEALAGEERTTFRVEGRRLLQIVTVPLSVGPDPPEVLGTLSLGFALDDALAAALKGMTGSDVAFAYHGEVLGSTLVGKVAFSDLEALLQRGNEKYARMVLGDVVVATRELAPATGGGPIAAVIRSRAESRGTSRTLNTVLLVTALGAIAVAVLLSYTLARTVTRPLEALTRAMSDVAATGDLTRKTALEGRWDDAEARGLARTFNLLTDSIARFQREAAERERLSALGRLSTVIAHEVRNPLMIIKASLRTLRRDASTPDARREAAADIDHEITRLDRIVGDVLDFSRPPRLELGPADVNEVCREAARAVIAGDEPPAIDLALDLDPALPPAVTDGERLRTVLVNVLANARESILARCGKRDATAVPAVPAVPDIEMRTRSAGDGRRITVVVHDRGEGIEPEHLPQIFDPYFTTRRTGTGLGLAIAASIVKALDGRISARSAPGEGTEIELDLPVAGPSGGPAGPAAA